MTEKIFYYPFGEPRTARDLAVGLLTCLLRDGRQAIRELRQVRPAYDDGPLSQSLRQEATRSAETRSTQRCGRHLIGSLTTPPDTSGLAYFPSTTNAR